MPEESAGKPAASVEQRNYRVIKGQVGPFPLHHVFTEREFRRLHPPSSTDDKRRYQEMLLSRLLNLKVVVPTHEPAQITPLGPENGAVMEPQRQEYESVKSAAALIDLADAQIRWLEFVFSRDAQACDARADVHCVWAVEAAQRLGIQLHGIELLPIGAPVTAEVNWFEKLKSSVIAAFMPSMGAAATGREQNNTANANASYNGFMDALPELAACAAELEPEMIVMQKQSSEISVAAGQPLANFDNATNIPALIEVLQAFTAQFDAEVRINPAAKDPKAEIRCASAAVAARKLKIKLGKLDKLPQPDATLIDETLWFNNLIALARAQFDTDMTPTKKAPSLVDVGTEELLEIAAAAQDLAASVRHNLPPLAPNTQFREIVLTTQAELGEAVIRLERAINPERLGWEAPFRKLLQPEGWPASVRTDVNAIRAALDSLLQAFEWTGVCRGWPNVFLLSSATTNWPPTEPDFADIAKIEKAANRLSEIVARVRSAETSVNLIDVANDLARTIREISTRLAEHDEQTPPAVGSLIKNAADLAKSLGYKRAPFELSHDGTPDASSTTYQLIDPANDVTMHEFCYATHSNGDGTWSEGMALPDADKLTQWRDRWLRDLTYKFDTGRLEPVSETPASGSGEFEHKNPSDGAARPAEALNAPPDSSMRGHDAMAPSQPVTTAPPRIDDVTFTVTWGRHECRFNSRSKLLFALFARLNLRPGHRVDFDKMRKKGDVWDDANPEDTTIRGAVTRLKKKLVTAHMNNLANAISTSTFKGRAFAVFDLQRISSSD